jgi:hypothetical protein
MSKIFSLSLNQGNLDILLSDAGGFRTQFTALAPIDQRDGVFLGIVSFCFLARARNLIRAKTSCLRDFAAN